MSETPATPENGNGYSASWLTDRRLNQVVMVLVAFGVIIYLLQVFSVVLQQLLIAGFIAYLLVPIHHWLKRHRIPTVLAIVVIVAGIIAVTLGLTAAIRLSLEDLYSKMPQYERNFREVMGYGSQELAERNWFERAVRTGVLGLEANVREVRDAAGSVVSFTGHVFIVFVYLLFILAEQANVPRRIERAFDPPRAQEIRTAIQEINLSIGQYILVKTLVSILTGALSGIALYLFNVDYALLWGVITFLVNFIPYLGALVAMALPALLSLVQFQDPAYTLWIIVVLSVIQNGIGWGLEPVMTGARVNLSPFVVIASLAFWASLWGMVGMFLAIPLMVVAKTAMESIPSTRPIAVLLSNDRYRGGVEAANGTDPASVPLEDHDL